MNKIPKMQPEHNSLILCLQPLHKMAVASYIKTFDDDESARLTGSEILKVTTEQISAWFEKIAVADDRYDWAICVGTNRS